MLPKNSDCITVNAKVLCQFTKEIFIEAGCSNAEAQRIGHYLTKSNLSGHESHGVLRIPRYLHWLAEERVKRDQGISVVTENEALGVLDGNHGFGQTIGPLAVQFGIEKAKKHGLSLVGLRNSGHLGRIGDWGEMAAENDLISIHFVNTTGLGLLVAPFGGTERRLSTNPICIGVPSYDGKMFVLDFATSMVAEGKVLNALGGGAPLMADALIDKDGTLSSDPSLIYGTNDTTQPLDVRIGTGAIRAMGEHKGSGLSFMCEVLAGALTGSGCSKAGEKMLVNGMLSIYVAPKFLSQDASFIEELKNYIEYFCSSMPIHKNGKVFCPGDVEANNRAHRLVHGVPLPISTWESIIEAASNLGISDEKIPLTDSSL